MADGEKITDEVPAITDAQLRESTIGSLKEAEEKLARLGDQMHEQRRQVEAIRRKLEALT